VDVEPSGEAFNSISLDPSTGRPRNPMINAGAIAVTGMLGGSPEAPRFDRILQAFSRFAARNLDWDEEVYRSESSTGFRNRAIANMLRSFDHLSDPVDAAVEDYFRQCSIRVTCRDLAVMASTLARNGTNPLTGEVVVGATSVERTLSVMSTCGMYDYSGTWMYEVGIPAKSGVGGGVIGVLPGQFGFAAFSPLLDVKGNSVRGVAAFRELSRILDLHLLRVPAVSAHAIRRSYLLAEVAATRGRPAADNERLADLGRRVLIVELQGDLLAASLERLVRTVDDHGTAIETVVVDLRRAGTSDGSTAGLLRGLARDVHERGQELFVADPSASIDPATFEGTEAVVTTSLDDALLRCEEALLGSNGGHDPETGVLDAGDFELTRELGDHERARLLPRLTRTHVPAGTAIIEEGTDAEALYLLAAGVVRVSASERPGGQERRISDLYPGVVFGELGVLQRARRSATVRAVTDAVCYVLPREELMHLRSTDHLIYTRIIEHLLVSSAERLGRTSQEVTMLRE